MTLSPSERIHAINMVLMLAACALAFLFPYGLLLFSYAMLGPAHYLTQISWLHDRRYFTPRKHTLAFFCVLTLGIIFLQGLPSHFMLIFALCAGLAMVIPANIYLYAAMLAAAAIASLLFSLFSPVALFMAILLPTVLHVFFFTFNFILFGSLKEKSGFGYASLATMIACAASFLFLSPAALAVNLDTSHPGIAFFQVVVDYIQTLFLLPPTEQTGLQIFAFLSFAYTYHYLNWFSKTRVIRWHEISRRRLMVIVALYLLSLGVYFYDYVLGFYILLFLSLLHVLLEFPLNWRTLGMIGSHIIKPVSAAAKP